MRKVLVIALAALFPLMANAQKTTVDIHDIAVKVSEKGLDGMDLGHYMGTCLYHGMADLAIASGDPADMERVMKIMRGFVSGEIQATFFNSYSYYVGGQAMPFLAWKTGNKELAAKAIEYANKMWTDQARTSDNIMTANNQKKRLEMDGFWIDMAFTLTPYLLFSGILTKNQEWIDYSAWEILTMYKVLYDKESNGLFHQARAIGGLKKGEISEDCWSRGNGWGSMAFGSELLYYPKNGKYYKEIRKQARNFYDAAIRHMDANGLWHQEMTNFDSYAETSGSAQLVAGIGAAIEAGVLPRKQYLPVFEKALKGLLGYIDPDGSIGHCCQGNLAPGTKGLKKEYEKAHFYFNESHVFGPAVLALAQALRLGYKTVELDKPLGHFNDVDRPRTYCKFVTERKEDFAWENDQIAFRIYSRAFVHNRAASGVDLWPKSVDYSIIDKRYWENNNKISYHKDHGEGCDFYNMGNGRGIGGTAFWYDGKPVLPEQYTNYRIYRNDSDRIDFRLDFQPLKVGDDIIYSTKRIEMVKGTPFYKVTETLESGSGKDITLAIGVTNFGKAKVSADKQRGILTIVEDYEHPEGIYGRKVIPTVKQTTVCSGIMVDPAKLVDITTVGKDEYVLVTVKSGESVVYYAGALWNQQLYNGSAYLSGAKYWSKYISENCWTTLNELYK